MKNYYKILEVRIFASHEEIRAAHRKLAMKFHPDKNNGDKDAEEKFKEVQFAYELLSDSNKRARYDEIVKRILQNPNLYVKIVPKSPPVQTIRRPSPYIYDPKRGRFIKRRRF
jgi:curved DNA-binding protein CbpA